MPAAYACFTWSGTVRLIAARLELSFVVTRVITPLQAAKKDPSCLACNGRHVAHTCARAKGKAAAGKEPGYVSARARLVKRCANPPSPYSCAGCPKHLHGASKCIIRGGLVLLSRICPWILGFGIWGPHATIQTDASDQFVAVGHRLRAEQEARQLALQGNPGEGPMLTVRSLLAFTATAQPAVVAANSPVSDAIYDHPSHFNQLQRRSLQMTLLRFQGGRGYLSATGLDQ
eukprot:COSAG05_NODE_1010_length_6207_cov_3.771447_1_plen_230_part_10